MSEVAAAEAEKLFKAALAKHRAGNLIEALNGYREAIGVAPAHRPAHQNLAVVLRQLNRPEEALASADAALALHPAHAGLHTARGRALSDLRRPEEALASHERAVALAPREALNHQNRGAVLLVLDRPQEALEAFERARAITPEAAQQHINVGVALDRLGRTEAAADAFASAAALQPTSVEAHRNLALMQRRLGRFEEALASVDRALALKTRDASLHLLRGNVLFELQRMDAALESYDRALALKPDDHNAHHGRGAALGSLQRLEEALAAYDVATALDPNFAAAHRNRGVILRMLRRPAEAVLAQDRAIALSPNRPNAYWYRSLCHLVMRDFEAGWRDYERRWEVDEFLASAKTNMNDALRARLNPDLTLDDIAGRDVLLVGEQGVGDVIMFASAIPDLMAVAGRVALNCDPRLRGLLANSFPRLELLDVQTTARRAPEFPIVMGVGSLGRHFRNRLEDFPGSPYLSPQAETVAKWVGRLGPAEGRRRVGISWRGGVASTGRTARSMDLTGLRPVLDLPGCEFVSLQYGDVTDELAAANADLPSPIRAFPKADIDDFDDLAGLVKSLDLVVSVQTSLVHLTGALGAPGLVMVPATPEWRYGASGSDMPWYRSIRLFRQGDDGDWTPVVQQVAAEAAVRLGLP